RPEERPAVRPGGVRRHVVPRRVDVREGQTLTLVDRDRGREVPGAGSRDDLLVRGGGRGRRTEREGQGGEQGARPRPRYRCLEPRHWSTTVRVTVPWFPRAAAVTFIRCLRRRVRLADFERRTATARVVPAFS